MLKRGRILFMALVLVMLCATAVCFADESTTKAAANPGLDPQYNIGMTIMTAFNIDSGIAQCSVTVETDPGVADTVNMRIVLERKTASGYTVVKTWRDQLRTFDSGGYASIYRPYSLTERGTYRFRASGTLYKNDNVIDTYKDVTSVTDVY